MSATYRRDSRYHSTGEVTRVDHTGRVLTVDDLRRQSIAPASFQHTVDANDRLDHLANRYYGKPRKWWLVADANPGFASPLAMLGQEPLTGIELEVTRTPDLEWWTVLRDLRATAGVESVVFDLPDDERHPSVLALITVRFNEATLSAQAVRNTASDLLYPRTDARPGIAAREVARIGRRILVPPQGVT